MNKGDKAIRKALLKELERLGGMVKFNPESGVTVATMPSIQGANAKFGRVAFAMCSKDDTAKRKKGELLAVQNLFDGISFPVKIENWSGFCAEDWQQECQEVFSQYGYL